MSERPNWEEQLARSYGAIEPRPAFGEAVVASARRREALIRRRRAGAVIALLAVAATLLICLGMLPQRPIAAARTQSMGRGDLFDLRVYVAWLSGEDVQSRYVNFAVQPAVLHDRIVAW